MFEVRLEVKCNCLSVGSKPAVAGLENKGVSISTPQFHLVGLEKKGGHQAANAADWRTLAGPFWFPYGIGYYFQCSPSTDGFKGSLCMEKYTYARAQVKMSSLHYIFWLFPPTNIEVSLFFTCSFCQVPQLKSSQMQCSFFPLERPWKISSYLSSLMDIRTLPIVVSQWETVWFGLPDSFLFAIILKNSRIIWVGRGS